MQTSQIQQALGTKAVHRLRKKKLQLGHPFMINSKTLPTGQFYLEYPSGIIKLAVISESKRDYEILKELSNQETLQLRRQYDLH